MIDAKDLRIGNLVYGISDRIETVVSLGVNFMTTNVGKLDLQTTFEYDLYEPIPLTPDILIRLGFDEGMSNFLGYYYKDLISNVTLLVAFDGNGGVAVANRFADIITIRNSIQYLHELMNLFHSLTGTELTFNQQ